MRLAVFGSTGKTGLEVVKQALGKGHSVTAFVRNPERLTIAGDGLSIVTGDVFDPTSVAEAVRGQDAVICVLGQGNDIKKTSVRTMGTKNIINGMQEHHVTRLVAVTAMGIGESWNTLSLVNKMFFATVLKSARDDHEGQEEVIKKSKLDWTIIRPSGLEDTPKTGIYEVGESIQAKTSRIPRADVADLILIELEKNQWIGKAVTITN